MIMSFLQCNDETLNHNYMKSQNYELLSQNSDAKPKFVHTIMSKL